jgi:hypothetical protein
MGNSEQAIAASFRTYAIKMACPDAHAHKPRPTPNAAPSPSVHLPSTVKYSRSPTIRKGSVSSPSIHLVAVLAVVVVSERVVVVVVVVVGERVVVVVVVNEQVVVVVDIGVSLCSFA